MKFEKIKEKSFDATALGHRVRDYSPTCSSFVDIKQDILGKKYSLSIGYVSEKKSREINKKYRKIDKPTNVLSFALDKNEGEIILCKSVIRKELKKFNKTFEQLLSFLIIHGMLHLKGMEHGEKMEKAEKKYLPRTKFLIK